MTFVSGLLGMKIPNDMFLHVPLPIGFLFEVGEQVLPMTEIYIFKLKIQVLE